MITVTVYGSSSDGNCTILKDRVSGKMIVMDCGIPIPPKIKMENILAVFITHSHSDHRKCIKDWKSKPIYTNEPDLLDKYTEKGFNIHPISVEDIGPFQVVAIRAQHDTKLPCHYRVSTKDDSVWYGCDAHEYRPVELSFACCCKKIMVDCNYDELFMKEKDTYPKQLKKRIIGKGHASNQYIYDTFGSVKEHLILMHLSRVYNSPKQVRKVFGKQIKVVDKVPKRFL